MEDGIPMIFKHITIILFVLYFMSSVAVAAELKQADAEQHSRAELAPIIASANQFDKPGERIVAISGHFVNAPYAANTLIGGPQKTEQLVLDLTQFDCFTFLDVVEALRRSAKADDFPAQLKQVRYRDGEVAYTKRRHFFSDWVADVDTPVKDVTGEVGQGSVQAVVKQLNRKKDGTLWLSGLGVTPREIIYIPTSKVDAKLLSALQAGDYVGLFSEHAGLDVNHTGLIVMNKDKIMLRHASSRSGVGRVVDEDLFAYLQGKPGLVVYRVKP
jgi:hypothetical protein